MPGEPTSAFAVYSEKLKHVKQKKQRQKSRKRTHSQNVALKRKIKLSNGLKENFDYSHKKPHNSIKRLRPNKKVKSHNREKNNLNSQVAATQKKKKRKIIKTIAIENTTVEVHETNENQFTKIEKEINAELVQTENNEDSFIVNTPDENEDTFRLSENLLSFLMAPLKPGDFFKRYWEKEPMYIKRCNTNYFKKLLTSEKLDKIIRENPLYYTRNIDVVTYENGQRQTFNPEGRAIPATVWDYYSNGCSIRLLNPQTYCSKIRSLLATLQEYFGTMVGANVYLTPHGSQGFAPHYDDIEAFVLQLEGRKHWKVYSPRSESETLPRHSSHNFAREELGEPSKEITLEAGDLLYFPRGLIHEACTDKEAHSLHITISVYQKTAYVDLLERLLPEALKNAAENDLGFRKGLPLHYLRHLGTANAENSSRIREKVLFDVKNLINKLVNYAPIDWAVDQMGRKFMHESLPPTLTKSEKNRSCKNDGDVLIDGTVCNRGEFSLDTMVRLVRYHSLQLVVENETSAKIYYCSENANVYHGEEEQSLEIDLNDVNIVKSLLHHYPNYVSIERLAGDKDVEKVQVVSDLWEKGLIITKEPLDIVDE